MADKSVITLSFWSQLSIICVIITCSITGFRYGVNEMRMVVSETVQPLIKRVEDLEKRVNDNDNLIVSNANSSNSAIVSLNNFLNYYSSIYHHEFLRPNDITAESIVSINKKNK